MFNTKSKRKGLLSIVKKHPGKSTAVSTTVAKAAGSKAGKAIAASAAVGAVGYLVYRKMRPNNGLHKIRRRSGDTMHSVRSFFRGKMSHL